MKRVKGFTLAEVLITLGIIGVVAALTAPALIQNAGNAKIGPTLQKVKSTIENANEHILYENEASDLYSVAGNNTVAYMELLSKYISGSSYESNTAAPNVAAYNGEYTVKDSYVFYFSNAVTIFFNSTSDWSTSKGSFEEDYLRAIVDINGADREPNVLGKDIFDFHVSRNGIVVPTGSKTYKWLRGDDYYWNSTGDLCCNDTTVGTGAGCSGSIFDNNLKVIYQ